VGAEDAQRGGGLQDRRQEPEGSVERGSLREESSVAGVGDSSRQRQDQQPLRGIRPQVQAELLPFRPRARPAGAG
jgi:hypothetical protein